MNVTAADRLAMRQHAIDAYPHESVGVLTPDGYVRCNNMASAELVNGVGNRYQMDPEQWVHLEPVALAVIHSHPKPAVQPSPAALMDMSYEGPSAADMAAQVAVDLPFGIVVVTPIMPGMTLRAAEPYFWGDMLPVQPLVGRGFRHGPSGTDHRGDCAAILRDAYRLGAAALLPLGCSGWPFPPLTYPDSPRDDAWWLNGGSGYLENFEKSGFERATVNRIATDLQVGDVILAQIMSRVPNHGMLYLGNGLILHHKPGRLSCVETAHRWVSRSSTVLRRRRP